MNGILVALALLVVPDLSLAADTRQAYSVDQPELEKGEERDATVANPEGRLPGGPRFDEGQRSQRWERQHHGGAKAPPLSERRREKGLERNRGARRYRD